MQRNPFFDNAKFILIVLVIIGHLIEPWAVSGHPVKAIYLLIYSFHMPTFIFISGYFAKKGKIKKIAPKYLGLFALFTLFYTPFSGQNMVTNLLRPYWILWFLVSLVYWHVLIEVFAKIKMPILLSVVIAVVAGYFDQIGYVASLSRTLVFFPFFLAGFYARKKGYNSVSKPLAMANLCAVFALLCLLYPVIDHRWLYGSYSYSALGYPQWYAGVYRLEIYTINVLITGAFLSLIPSTKKIYTYWGTKTLSIYLLHGFIIKLLFVSF